MAITEEVRHKIYEAVLASYGDEVANGLMELLPPVGWADVATKHDLAALEERTDLRFDLLEARLGERLERSMRLQSARFTATMAAMFTAFGLIDRLVLS